MGAVTLSSTEGPISARACEVRDRWGEIVGAIVEPLSWPTSWSRDGAREAVRLAILDGRIRC